MRSFNMTVGIDIEANFLIKITYEDGGILRGAQRSVTLSGNDYSGQIFHTQSWRSLSKEININKGGGLGNTETTTFFLMRDNQDSITKDFINSWFPTGGKPRITSYYAEIGVIWDGATSESQITWLKYYYIEDYKVNYDLIALSLVEFDELENLILPQYKVQDQINNGISYFPNAEEVIGEVIPVLYGSFTQTWSEDTVFEETANCYSPLITINKTLSELIICSHEVWTASDYIFRYLSEPDVYMKIENEEGGAFVDNNQGRAIIKMQSTAWGKLLGELILPLRQTAKGRDTVETNVPDDELEKMTDNDLDTYGTMDVYPATYCYFKVSSSLSEDLVGYLSQGLTDANMKCWAERIGTTAVFELLIINTTRIPSVADGIYSNASPFAKTLISAPIGKYAYDITIPASQSERIKDINDFLTMDWGIQMLTSTGSPTARVYGSYLHFQNINILGLNTRDKRTLYEKIFNLGRGKSVI